MKITTSISEMHKFQFGRKIVCYDREAGSLGHVVFDVTARRMTHLSVNLGRLFGKTVTYEPTDGCGRRGRIGFSWNAFRHQ